MKAFRNIDINDLLEIIKDGVVHPRPFTPNADSEAPVGNWSFWFNAPTLFGSRGDIIVVGELENYNSSMMRYSTKDDYDLVEYEVEEYYTSQPIQVERIIILDTCISDIPEDGMCTDIFGDVYFNGKFSCHSDDEIFGELIITMDNVKKLSENFEIEVVRWSDVVLEWHINRRATEINRVETPDYN